MSRSRQRTPPPQRRRRDEAPAPKRVTPLDGLAVARSVNRRAATGEQRRRVFAEQVANAMLTGGRIERHLGHAELVALVAAVTQRWESLDTPARVLTSKTQAREET